MLKITNACGTDINYGKAEVLENYNRKLHIDREANKKSSKIYKK